LISNIDESDIQIIKLLIKGNNNKEISSKLHIPLSTVQLRTKRILKQELVITTTHLNRCKFGYRTGLIHVYCSDKNIQQTAKEMLEFGGVTSVEIHIGNSDILADFAYKESKELFDVILKIKQISGIERVIWSERISRSTEKDYDLLLNN
jgi:Lrp/AsnC family transcriptional regulator for asnA, asnC and gidA